MKFRDTLLCSIPFLVLLSMWELLVIKYPEYSFYFSRPSQVIWVFFRELLFGPLLKHCFITSSEAFLGFLVGTILGTTIGVVGASSSVAMRSLLPFVRVLGVVPIYAIAPMTIMWFGIGFSAKVWIAALSTLFVAAKQSLEGASKPDPLGILVFRSFRATDWQTLTKLRLPSATSWVLASCHLNIGFALLGAFIGEVISSDSGLGHYIMKASALYDVTQVFAGVACMIIIAFLFEFIVNRFAFSSYLKEYTDLGDHGGQWKRSRSF